MGETCFELLQIVIRNKKSETCFHTNLKNEIFTITITEPIGEKGVSFAKKGI